MIEPRKFRFDWDKKFRNRFCFENKKTCEFCELFIETFLSFCESYRLTFHTWGYKVTQIYFTFFMIFYEFSGFYLIVTFNLLRFNFNDDYFSSVKKVFILFWFVWLQKFAEFSVLVNFSVKSFDKLFGQLQLLKYVIEFPIKIFHYTCQP